MCSVGDDESVDDVMINEAGEDQFSEPIRSGACHKCGQNGELYKLVFREAECKSCFLNYVNHKFRATVGSSKAVPRDAEVLVVYDGSAESVVLLDMLKTAKSGSNFKKLHCHFKVIIVDDYELRNKALNALDYETYLQEMKDTMLSDSKTECYITNLRSDPHQMPYNIKDIDHYLARKLDDENMFSIMYSNIRTSTNRKEFIKIYLKKLLASMAQHLKCNYVFIPTININIAADFLSSIALGRGSSVGLDVGFVDDRLENGIRIMRPIKDLSVPEVNLYLRACNLKSCKQYNESSPGTADSIQGITESFIKNLQKNFTSTVSTIIRTGNKIAYNNFSNIHDKTDVVNQDENTISCEICCSCFQGNLKQFRLLSFPDLCLKEVQNLV
ncbi:unnamed protein product [Ceratitis capitata]|uniref:Cytoplasmic tRNA 2-thiolation protein 2 n=1 Tax=Ceratitis capitata TaxID=7213 RepID=A0A811UNB2_CERCA|nr:unnamed protein product [Ceratitis capitata]